MAGVIGFGTRLRIHCCLISCGDIVSFILASFCRCIDVGRVRKEHSQAGSSLARRDAKSGGGSGSRLHVLRRLLCK